MKNYTNCVYRLYFEGDDRSYIGSARKASTRLRYHIWELLKKAHSNKLLQIAFNKEGYLAYRWEILESNIKPSKLLEREYYYIKQYKADTEGFNQTMTTNSAKNKLIYIPEDISYDTINYIKWWIENKNVEFKEIWYTSRKDKRDNNSYSKVWWSSLNANQLVKIQTNIYNYARNISKIRIKTTMMICGGEEVIEKLEVNKNKIHSTIVSFIKKFKNQPETKQKIEDIIVTSALNPLHTEMLYMSNNEITEYRVFKLFKLLQDCNIADKITIHLPQKYYKGMVQVIDRVKNNIV